MQCFTFLGKELVNTQKDSFLAANLDKLMDFVENINPLTLVSVWGLEMPEKEAARKAACEEGGLI